MKLHKAKIYYNPNMNEILEFFELKQKHPSGYYILGNANKDIVDTLQTNISEIVISHQTILKNISHHTDLSINDYKNLDKIIGKYNILIKDGEYTVGIVHYEYEEYYYALKSTKSRNTIFLTSFRKTSKHDIQRLKNKLSKGKIEVIKGKL